MVSVNLFLGGILASAVITSALSPVVSLSPSHCRAAWYSATAPMAVVNFLIEQHDILGESNLPQRNNKATLLFFFFFHECPLLRIFLC